MLVNFDRFLNSQLKLEKCTVFVKLFTKTESGNVDNYN